MAVTKPEEARDAALPEACADVNNYDYLKYVSKQRMVSFWYHLAELMQLDASNILEVGIGPGIVSSVLRWYQREIKTADINPALHPDYLAPVQRLSSVVPAESFDVILCARVLHYVSPEELEQTLRELHAVTRRYLILTLPVDELRLSLGGYLSTRPWHWVSLRFPLMLKRVLLSILPARPEPIFGKTWKLDCCKELTTAAFQAKLSKLFTIEKSYLIPEVTTHRLFLLSKRSS